MIIQVKNKRQLHKFIYYIKDLYFQDSSYVYPIFSSLKKELNEQVLKTEKYTALLSVNNGRINGRILYTTNYDKTHNKEIGFFSFFDLENDTKTAKELIDYMTDDLKSKGIDYVEGTYCPYDPDTRRGILVKGFDEPHTIFTSKNYEYYQYLIESCGFTKAYDTYSMHAEPSERSLNLATKVANRCVEHFDLVCENLDTKNIDNELKDIEQIMKEATNENNYQDAIGLDEIREIADKLLFFIEPKFIKIVRERESRKPIGFGLTLPDFNQVLLKTKGKIKPLRFMIEKKKINQVRGMLQYVIPEYQRTGAIYIIFAETIKSINEAGITYFEGGTMMENNFRSWKQFEKFGGNINKIYRIYGKEI